ncbi:phospholipase D-like domain-containing protein [Pectobacterium brasiliense]|uniref:phospholipase D-like domain-containing protein n=1 Tax=Pectobacterium brasiliense TaxID=180957 RepID=UPI0039869119
MNSLSLVSNECHFKDIEFHIRKKLKSATKSIRICVAWINVKKYSELLLRKMEQGVTIQIICNSDFFNKKGHENIPLTLKECITYINNPVRYHLMHNKFCIIDDNILISGSYNWSDRANMHYENIIIITNDFKLNKKFKHTFFDLLYMAAQSNNYLYNIYVDKNIKTFNLGTFSNPYGCLNTVSLQTWKINISDNTYQRLSHSIDVPSFFESIDFDISPDDYPNNQDYYNNLFDNERGWISQIQDYFKNSSTQVHAIGYAVIANNHAYSEYDEEPEREIHFSWVDIRLKNALPSIISAEGELGSLWEEINY